MKNEKKQIRISSPVGPSSRRSEDHPIRQLKAIVLTIDWEITDEVMARFFNQVDRLNIDFEGNRLALLMLKILDSVGRYIQGQKEKANPYAMTVLKATYVGLETMVMPRNAHAVEEEKILNDAIKRFKKLKHLAAPDRAVDAGKTRAVTHGKEGTAGDKPEASVSNHQQEQIKDPALIALAEIRDLIHDELSKFRKEMNKIRTGN